jgi:hypothetical protein
MDEKLKYNSDVSAAVDTILLEINNEWTRDKLADDVDLVKDFCLEEKMDLLMIITEVEKSFGIDLSSIDAEIENLEGNGKLTIGAFKVFVQTYVTKKQIEDASSLLNFNEKGFDRLEK